MNGRRLPVPVLILLAALLAACSTAPDTEDFSGPPVTLRVLAGSELADMVPILERARQETGVRVELRYTGSLAGADDVASGRAGGTTDAVWFSSTRYLDLDPRTRGLVGTSTPIMSSPVVLGLRRSAAERLGWVGRDVGWGEIAAAAGRGGFTFGMTDPSVSNSGFSALVGVAAAVDGSGAAPDAAGIARAGPALSALFRAQSLTAGSSGYLVDAFVDRATGRVPGPPVDGLIGYESSLQSLDRGGRVGEPLVLVRPVDGVVTADYPLTALTSVTPAVRDGYARLTGWLRRPDIQQMIADTTLRRPGVPTGAAPRPDQPPVVELPFPGSRAVVDALLEAYFDRYRRPPRTAYVLDVSGSMAGPRLAALQQSLVGLTSGAGTSGPVREREELTLLPFSDTPRPTQLFTVEPADPQAARAAIRAAAQRLTTGGNTAVYDAVIAAYRGLERAPAADRITTVVLMTDGESNTGAGPEALRAYLAARPPSVRGVPVFAILFGEAAVPQMTDIATATGGKMFDARRTPLPEIFREIRGYQ